LHVEKMESRKKTGEVNIMGEQVKVLIVEKEMTSHEHVLKALDNSVQILSAKSVHQAMEVIRLQNPHFIVVDSQWPGIDGIEILRGVKKVDNAMPEKFVYGDLSNNEFLDELKTKVCIFDERLKTQGQQEECITGPSTTLDVLIRNAVDYNIQNNVGLEHALRNFKQVYFDYVSGHTDKPAQGGL
jgi:CheY-like chemotaxis protein